MELKEIEALAVLLKEHPVSEIRVTGQNGVVHLRKNLAPIQASPMSAQPAAGVEPTAPAGSASSVGRGNKKKTTHDAHTDPTVLLTSTLVGIFHHANPTIRPGANVKAGQTVGHVETMKLMNEVVAEANSQIVEVTVEDGETVMYGQPLFRLMPA